MVGLDDVRPPGPTSLNGVRIDRALAEQEVLDTEPLRFALEDGDEGLTDAPPLLLGLDHARERGQELLAGIHKEEMPIQAQVAGVALGLITGEDGRYAILTDIQGVEDFLGDMDLKIAGSERGITALQMDLKVHGLPFEVLSQAFAQARQGRLYILQAMNAVISRPRPELSPYAPRIVKMRIDPEKIGAVIGPGGKTIRSIIEASGAEIEVEDDGSVYITTPNVEGARIAIRMIEQLAREPKVGDVYLGKVVRIMPYGAFVNILPNRDGMVHISELDENRVARVEDVVQVGDEINVMITQIDPDGKISLSRRAVLTGEKPDRAAARKQAWSPGAGRRRERELERRRPLRRPGR